MIITLRIRIKQTRRLYEEQREREQKRLNGKSEGKLLRALQSHDNTVA